MTSLTRYADDQLSSSGVARLVPATTAVATVGCGLVAGLLFIFSTCIMPSLRRQPPAHAIATMQSINQTILNPLFFLVFMGSTVLCAALGLFSIFSDAPGRGLRIAAAVIFLVGVIGITAAFNVPMNDHLAQVVPGSAHGAEVWRDYLTRWTLANHVRAAAATLATALFAWSELSSRR